jgi:redox-sensitive bicupin YhaK (pirin superfamily)
LEDRDSLGNGGIVSAGGVQYMSAGTGVTHSEDNHASFEPLFFLQMWLVPSSTGGTPLYGQVDFDVDQRRNRWLLVASGSTALDAPVRLRQDATLSVSRLEDGKLHHSFGPGRLGCLFVAQGELAACAYDGFDHEIADDVTLAAGDAVRVGGGSRIIVRG